MRERPGLNDWKQSKSHEVYIKKVGSLAPDQVGETAVAQHRAGVKFVSHELLCVINSAERVPAGRGLALGGSEVDTE